MVGLKIYKVKDKETYQNISKILSGWCFFREDKNEYFIKAPEKKVIKDLIKSGLIEELHQQTTE